MPFAFIAAMVCTVVLMVTNAYFLMGSLPLLTLKHDTPLDARFIRGFYDTYYLFAICTAVPAAISYAFLGRPYFAVGAGALAALAFALRRIVPQRMDKLRSRIVVREDQVAAILEFRRLHVVAIVINVVQLALIVGCMIALSVAMKAE
ncbi:MAG: hypothetical protein WC829_21095 [Hyphomicrobium sp.]|jgi:hypothetical protein